MPAHRIPLKTRFEAKVNKNGPKQPHMKTRCHEWVGAQFRPTRYGAIQVEGKAERAHRVAWKLQVGPIPDGLDVLHHCDNEACVRLTHLYVGDAQDNARDRVVRGRTACGATHGSVIKPGSLPRGADHHMSRDSGKLQGELNGNAKINEATAIAILAEYQPGYGELVRLAIKYNRKRSLIEQLISGRTWKHLRKAG